MSGAYYNEWDPYAAGWLRNLIAAGLLPEGDVDTRSITDVDLIDLVGYDQVHFFAGIGGWPYALRLAGWPDDKPVWTGSCPCQPFSAAGKRKGVADVRHLWPEFKRLVAIGRPAIVFGEQVASKDGREWLAGVRADLEALGYAVGAADLCAAGVGAPHIRQRLYWVANADSRGRKQTGQRGDVAGVYATPAVERRPSPESGSCRGLADADGGLTGDGDLQRSGQHGLQPQDGGPGGGVGYPSGERRHGRQDTAEPDGRRGAQDDGRVGDTDDTRPQGRDLGRDRTDERALGRAGVAGFWSDALWLPCTDGKARRTQPGIFPLAHGVPGRVGKLRAAGNAIVPQVAAEFIKAVTQV